MRVFVLCALSLLACSRSTEPTAKASSTNQPPAPTAAEYEQLFVESDAAAATPNVPFGIWRTGGRQAEARLKITPKAITFALRCRPAGEAALSVRGLTVAAEVTASSIRVLEQKELAFNGCSFVNASVSDFSMCSATKTSECVRLDGTSLQFWPSKMLFDSSVNDGNGTFKKLSD